MITKEKADALGLAVIGDGNYIKGFAKMIDKTAYSIGMDLYKRKLNEEDVDVLERALIEMEYFIEHMNKQVTNLREEISQIKFEQMTIEE